MKVVNINISKFLSLMAILCLSMVLTSCGGVIDDGQETECTTFDEIFDVGKLSDVTVSGVTKEGNRIEICQTPSFYMVPPGSTTPVLVPAAGCQGITSWVYSQVKNVVDKSGEKLWKSIGENRDFKNIVASAIVLVIMFYGLMIMLGMTQVSGYSALMIFLKISLVFMFATQYPMFDKYVIQTFEALVDQTTKAAANVFITGTSAGTSTGQIYGVLNQIDLMISFVWDPKMMQITIGLFTAGASGFFWALALFAMTVMYLIGVLNALKIFIISLVGRYVLYALGPIFLVFALFSQTRSLFEGWVEQIISFTLQPVFLFIFLSIFHALMAGMMINIHKNSVNKDAASMAAGAAFPPHQTAVCNMPDPKSGTRKLEVVNCVVEAKKIAGVTVPSVISGAICGKEFDVTIGGVTKPMYLPCVCKVGPYGYDTIPVSGVGGGIDMSFIAILSVLIISYMLMPMANWVVQLAATISGGQVSAASAQIAGMQRVEQEVGKGANKIMQNIKKEMGDDKANRNP